MAEYLYEEDMNTGEYISRDVALRQLNATCLATACNNYNGVMCRACAYADAMDLIDAIPAADVQPIIHAHWIRGEEKGFRTYNPLWYCSNCGGQIRYDTRMRQYQKAKRPVWEVNAFCRKCGARMDGDTE